MFILVENKKQIDGENVENELGKVRTIADYQFGKGVGEKLFPENIEIQLSPRTGRIRFINLNGERLATLRPTDGLLSLSIKAAKFMAENLLPPNALLQCKTTFQNSLPRAEMFLPFTWSKLTMKFALKMK